MRKNIILNFNSEIKEKFRSNRIPVHDGLGYLLFLHYGLDPSYTPKELERRVLASGIVSKNYSNDQVEWRIPLFEETESGYEWIGEWMDLFKEKNPHRRGTKSFVLSRMKKFFVNNPSVRKEDVMEATKLYLRSVSDPTYCKKSHKFIYEQDGNSMLQEYVEMNNEKIEKTDKYDDVI